VELTIFYKIFLTYSLTMRNIPYNTLSPTENVMDLNEVMCLTHHMSCTKSYLAIASSVTGLGSKNRWQTKSRASHIHPRTLPTFHKFWSCQPEASLVLLQIQLKLSHEQSFTAPQQSWVAVWQSVLLRDGAHNDHAILLKVILMINHRDLDQQLL
jgi:hypothetical protein